MAAPTGVTAAWDNVIITIDNSTLGIVGNSPTIQAGTVEAIGANVTRCAVNDVVMFTYSSASPFSLTSGSDTWVVVPQENIKLIYVELAP